MPETAVQRIGRYEILQEIGRGAMGVVFKGRDPLIGRAVAVKTITAGVAESGELLERFYREARAAGGLQHPNIVTIYELAESGGAPFIAMEYLEGESLEKLIARRPALPLATKLGYVVQICRALDFAHRRGVFHRDVKPANIVVTRDEVVKVVDFGIARLADASKTQTGTLVGTLAYMSPERVRGEQSDAGGDIWAVGVLLYELIAYQRPFSGENHAALLMSILQQEPPSILHFLPQCPAALERVILKALQKDEKQRYASMEALLRNLENVNASLTREESRALTSLGDDQTQARNQLMDPGASKNAAQMPGAKINVHSAPTVLVPSHMAGSGVGAAAAKPEAHKAAKAAPTESARPKSRRGRTALALCAILALIVVAGFAAVHRDPAVAAAAHQAWARIANLASRESAAHPFPIAIPDTRTAATPVSAQTQMQPNTETATTDAGDGSGSASAAAPPSIEEQQRYLINLAQQAAGWQDYKGAQQQLDEAAKLNGPLSTVIADLRSQYSAQSHALELQRVSEDEQTLWDKAMGYINAGDLDDADESMREILTLPEGGHRWSEAASYVDEVIPERRQEEQLWAQAQRESASRDPGHFLSELKALDEVLAAGGRHQQGARQRRDAVIASMIRDDAESHRMPEPVISNADQWQITRLKNNFDDLVQKGDAAAIEKLQQLQSEFKPLAETQGPLLFDAHDYLTNLIPLAQSHIQDRLAATASNLPLNNAYIDAVKEYDRAIAAQNASLLREKVLPLFREIAQSGGIRAKEARRYVDVLIPAALSKSNQ